MGKYQGTHSNLSIFVSKREAKHRAERGPCVPAERFCRQSATVHGVSGESLGRDWLGESQGQHIRR